MELAAPETGDAVEEHVAGGGARAQRRGAVGKTLRPALGGVPGAPDLRRLLALRQAAQGEPIARDAGHRIGQACHAQEAGHARRPRGEDACSAGIAAALRSKSVGAAARGAPATSPAAAGGRSGGLAARLAFGGGEICDPGSSGTPDAVRKTPSVGEARRARGRETAGAAHPRSCTRRPGLAAALEQRVGRDVQRVGEALQLVGGEAAVSGLDAADGGLVDAYPLGQGALAPALLLAQAARSARLCSRDAHRASFPSPPPSTLLHHCTPQYARPPASLHTCGACR